jgi:hypothetical protein
MNDYFLVVQASVRLLPGGVRFCTTTSRRTFVGRHCFHSFCIKLDRLFKLLNVSTVGNNTTGAFGTGSAFGYNLVLSHLFIVFFLFLYRLSVNTNNPYAAIILLIFTHSMIYFIIFEIKICRKIPKTLTNCTLKRHEHL